MLNDCQSLKDRLPSYTTAAALDPLETIEARPGWQDDPGLVKMARKQLLIIKDFPASRQRA
jgi:hypothetical protein